MNRSSKRLAVFLSFTLLTLVSCQEGPVTPADLDWPTPSFSGDLSESPSWVQPLLADLSQLEGEIFQAYLSGALPDFDAAKGIAEAFILVYWPIWNSSEKNDGRPEARQILEDWIGLVQSMVAAGLATPEGGAALVASARSIVIEHLGGGTAGTAEADAYTLLEGDDLSVPAGAGPPDGLLVNDDLGTPASTVTSFGGGSLGGAVTDDAAGASVAFAGGSLSVSADGSLTISAPDAVGDHTFSYRISNSAGDDDAVVTVTVLSAATPVDALDDVATATGNVPIEVGAAPGLLANDAGPGATVEAVQGLSTNVGVAVATSAGGSVTVQADGSFTYDPPPGFEGSDSFTYTAGDGLTTDIATVTVTVSDMVWFIDNSASSGDGRFASPFNSIAAFNTANAGGGATDPKDGDVVSLATGTGTYAEADGINLRNAQTVVGGGSALDAVVTAAANSTAAYTGYAGFVGTRPVITASVGNGVDLAAGNTLRGLDVGDTGGYGVLGIGVGTLVIDEVGVSGEGGALSLTGGGDVSGVTLDDLSSSSSTARGIDLSGISGTMTVSAASTGIAGSALEAVRIASGSVNLDYPGAISNATGGIMLSANSGTIDFGGTLTLTGSGLARFRAAGGGTVTVTGSGSTVANTSGTAVSIDGTTIGAGGVTFQSVSASGGTIGILLNSAGAGGFTISGVGTNDGSGGMIQASSSRGISAFDTDNIDISNVDVMNAGASDAAGCTATPGLCNAGIHLSSLTGASFTNVSVSGGTQQGINGVDLVDLTLDGVTVANVGNGTNEGAVRMTGLTGTVTVTNSLFDASADRNFQIVNGAGNLAMSVADSNFEDTQASGFGADGLEVQVSGTAALDLDVSGSAFLRNRTNGIQVIAEDASVATVDITGSVFDPGTGIGKAIDLAAANTATMSFDISANPTIYSDGGTAVNVVGFDNASLTGRINANADIQTDRTPGGASGGDGIRVVVEDEASIVVEIDDNAISNIYQDSGIQTAARNGGGRLDATINGNTIGLQTGAAFPLYGLEVRAQDTNTVCANVTGNAVTVGNGIAAFRQRTSDAGATVFLEGLVLNADLTWSTRGNTGSPVSSSNTGTLGGATCTTVPTPAP